MLNKGANCGVSYDLSTRSWTKTAKFISASAMTPNSDPTIATFSHSRPGQTLNHQSTCERCYSPVTIPLRHPFLTINFFERCLHRIPERLITDPFAMEELGIYIFQPFQELTREISAG